MNALVLALVLGQAVETRTVAVVPLSFADAAVDPEGLDTLLFGTVAGYFKKASAGAFVLQGKLFAPLTLDLPRDRFRDLSATAVAFEAREGPGALAGYDAAVFVAAGPVGARAGVRCGRARRRCGSATGRCRPFSWRRTRGTGPPGSRPTRSSICWA